MEEEDVQRVASESALRQRCGALRRSSPGRRSSWRGLSGGQSAHLLSGLVEEAKEGLSERSEKVAAAEGRLEEAGRSLARSALSELAINLMGLRKDWYIVQCTRISSARGGSLQCLHQYM